MANMQHDKHKMSTENLYGKARIFSHIKFSGNAKGNLKNGNFVQIFII